MRFLIRERLLAFANVNLHSSDTSRPHRPPGGPLPFANAGRPRKRAPWDLGSPGVSLATTVHPPRWLTDYWSIADLSPDRRRRQDLDRNRMLGNFQTSQPAPTAASPRYPARLFRSFKILWMADPSVCGIDVSQNHGHVEWIYRLYIYMC